MLPVVLHAVEGSDEEGDVGSGLAREVGEDLPEVLLAPGAADRLIDVAGATVVGRYGEHPVPVEGVHVLEVLAHGAGGLAGIHTLVDDRIDREAVDLAGAEHKLPEACRPHPGDGGGTECTLDDGEVLQLKRQPLPVELLLYDGEVVGGAAQHQAHKVAPAIDIEVYRLPHSGIVGERYGTLHPRQPLAVELILALQLPLARLSLWLA